MTSNSNLFVCLWCSQTIWNTKSQYSMTITGTNFEGVRELFSPSANFWAVRNAALIAGTAIIFGSSSHSALYRQAATSWKICPRWERRCSSCQTSECLPLVSNFFSWNKQTGGRKTGGKSKTPSWGSETQLPESRCFGCRLETCSSGWQEAQTMNPSGVWSKLVALWLRFKKFWLFYKCHYGKKKTCNVLHTAEVRISRPWLTYKVPVLKQAGYCPSVMSQKGTDTFFWVFKSPL